MSVDPTPAFSGLIDDRRGHRALAVVALTLGVVVLLGLVRPADDPGIAVSDPPPTVTAARAWMTPAATPRHPIEVTAPELAPLPDPDVVRPLPTAGLIAIGWYHDAPDDSPTEFGCCRDGFLRFEISMPGWSNATAGPPGDTLVLVQGELGAADRVTLRFGPITTVYRSPCDGTIVPSGPADSVDGLATALAGIQGVAVSATTRVRLRWSTASFVEVTIPADLPCGRRGTVPWSGDPDGTRRTTIPGVTNRFWIFNPNDSEGFGRVVVEAETVQGVDPSLLAEIETIVASIDHGG